MAKLQGGREPSYRRLRTSKLVSRLHLVLPGLVHELETMLDTISTW